MRISRFQAILTLLTVITLSKQSGAQGSLSGGSGGFIGGYKSYDSEAYNFFMEDEAASLSENLIAIGGGGYSVYENWIIGGYGFYRGNEKQNVQLSTPEGLINYDYSLQGGGGYFNLGYSILSNENFLAFPRLGLGFEALRLAKTVNRDLIYKDYQRLSASYSWASPMLDLGLGFDYFPFNGYGLKLGLRVGYQFSTERNNNDWQHEGGKILGRNLPDNNLDGFYLNLTIGGGQLAVDTEK